MKFDAPTEGNSPIIQRPLPAASPAASFVRNWLPVLLWCAVIFGFSSDAGSSRHTSRIIGPVLRWLIPDISDDTVDRVVLGVRKAAHMTEYAALALLVWRARRKPVRGDGRPWRWVEAAFGFGFAVLFAASDEIHQAFVPSREGRVVDVLIDTAGALLGLLAIRAWGRWRGRW